MIMNTIPFIIAFSIVHVVTFPKFKQLSSYDSTLLTPPPQWIVPTEMLIC